MIRLQNPERPLLKGYTQSVWLAHVEWILGDDVMNAEIALTADGRKFKPSWAICLNLEYEVRKEAAKRMTKGKSLAAALKEAREDRGILNKLFLTPSSMEAGAAAARAEHARLTPRPPAPPPVTQPSLLSQITADTDDASSAAGSDAGKGKRKGKGKGKNKGKSKPKAKAKTKAKPKQQPEELSWKKISKKTVEMKGCHKWQRGHCEDANCQWKHACAVCGSEECAAYWHLQ